MRIIEQEEWILKGSCAPPKPHNVTQYSFLTYTKLIIPLCPPFPALSHLVSHGRVCWGCTY